MLFSVLCALLYRQMQLDDFHFLPVTVAPGDDLAAAFSRVFGCEEAKKASGVVYCFAAEHPIPRVCGESRILYLGKTETSLHRRYARWSARLASGASGRFYQHILEHFGVISVGYRRSDNPRADELALFKTYASTHLEYPPKSRVG